MGYGPCVRTAAALAVVALGFRLLRSSIFDPGSAVATGVPTGAADVIRTGLPALAVPLGVRTVCAILAGALLAAPVIAARQMTERRSMLVPLSGMIGATCGAACGIMSGKAELPAGPVLILLVTAAALLSRIVPRSVGFWRSSGSTIEQRKPCMLPGVVLIFLLTGERTSVIDRAGSNCVRKWHVAGFERLRRTGITGTDAAGGHCRGVGVSTVTGQCAAAVVNISIPGTTGLSRAVLFRSALAFALLRKLSPQRAKTGTVHRR